MSSCCDGGETPLMQQRYRSSKQKPQNPLMEYITLREAGHAVALSYW